MEVFERVVKNWVSTFIGIGIMVLSVCSYFGIIVLPRTPGVWELLVGFLIGFALMMSKDKFFDTVMMGFKAVINKFTSSKDNEPKDV